MKTLNVITLIILLLLALCLIIWYFLFRVFIHKKSYKTLGEISSKAKSYLYWLLFIGVASIVIQIMAFVLKLIVQL